MTEIETYLATIAANLRGAGARRLAAELHDHVADALADGVAPTEVIDRLGPPEGGSLPALRYRLCLRGRKPLATIPA